MSPQRVREWLQESGKSRKWLASELGIAYSTLCNQLSTGKFSRHVGERISLIIEGPPGLAIELGDLQRRALERLATRRGVPIEEAARQVIIEYLYDSDEVYRNEVDSSF